MSPEPDTSPVGIEHLPDGVLVADGAARVVQLNSAAVRILQRQRDDLLGRDVREVLPLQDTQGRRWWTCTDPWNGLATRTGHRERLLLLPGKEQPIELFVTATYHRPGHLAPVDRVVLSVRDAISRRRTHEEDGALISTVAHELRSPLTSVKGFTATLLRRWDRFTDDQKRFMLETIEHDADRVTRLITELLDISRIDAGRLEVRRQPVDVESAARRYVDRMVASGTDARQFVVNADTELPEVWADPDRIEQVLANLLENAVRHGDGTVTLDLMSGSEVLTPGAAAEPVLVVSVSDEGEGIDEADLQRVFTRFWHGRRRGGTGLGLYLVRGLVEAHGGRITVGRAASGGAQFRFTLPASAPDHVA
ncbi:ATP-binding protein [Angustibacter sp. Root456]|uniref:sensor histidine kinase n=1 Tax=Angustibacter sp. Root456 TaxID=1736539 RepID=UPI0006FF460E|nr:ATP-binding protein [Angustibacter sp. Root456]KQX63576.1 PAS domain-containing sensor histidine kinase [Angustibacter sp. Root456]